MPLVRTGAAVLAAIVPLLAPAGCASTPAKPAESAAMFATEPLAAGRHVLVVLGMSCPKCISNVDLQLKRLPGVTAATVDMKHGTVTVEVTGDARPSARDFATAVSDAGFTLASIDGAPAGATP